MTLTVGEGKTFRGDLCQFELILADHQPFTFSKFADGEWAIMSRRPIDTTHRWNGEFRFDPHSVEDMQCRQLLLQAFRYQAEGYFVGVGCPCCMGQAAHAQMLQESQQPLDRLTWANLWVNGNYEFYRERIVPLFATYKRVLLVCNEKADVGNLPFRVTTTARVGTNAWREDLDVVEFLLENHCDGEGGLYLFCAGPLGNILAHHCHRRNPSNTYLDIGSTLDPWLFPGKQGRTRRYLRGEATSRKVCVWS